MQLLTLTDWIAILSGLAVIISLWEDFRKKKDRSILKIILTIIIALIICGLTIKKDRRDESTELAHKITDSTNEANIKKLARQGEQSKRDMATIKASLDTIGLAVNPTNGKVTVENKQKLKNLILFGNSSTNVTSINQQGGQTANEIINH